MADFYSKYTGEQVEQLLDQVASGNAGGGGGGITVETDPIFSASPAATITEEKIAEWNEKVDKVDGKQLSTEDFTTLLKQKLDGLSNYDDTELSEALSTLRGDFDALVSGDTTTAIKTFNEVIAFLDGIQDTQDLSGIIASIEQQIAGKMDKVTLATVATSGSYNDLADKPTIPAKLSELENDTEYVQRDPNTGFVELNDRVYVDEHAIVAHAFQDTQSKAYMLINSDGGITTYNSNDDSALKISVNGSGDKFLADDGKYKTALTEHQDISNKQDKLVSGTNIKTINGQSLIGSGDIAISGGSGDSSWRMTKEHVDGRDPITVKDNTYTIVNFTSATTAIHLEANNTNYIQHGVVYVSFGDSVSLNIVSLQTPTFASPDFLIKPNKTYEISFLYIGSCWLVSAIEFDETNIGQQSGGSNN